MKSLLKMPKQHLPSRKILYLRKQNAVVAQLVEHWLPKPRVAGSSPVYRSCGVMACRHSFFFLCPKGLQGLEGLQGNLVALRTPSRPKPYSLFQKRESLCLPDGSAEESPMPKRPKRALRATRLFSCPANSLPAKAVLPLSKEGEFMLA